MEEIHTRWNTLNKKASAAWHEQDGTPRPDSPPDAAGSLVERGLGSVGEQPADGPRGWNGAACRGEPTKAPRLQSLRLSLWAMNSVLEVSICKQRRPPGLGAPSYKC